MNNMDEVVLEEKLKELIQICKKSYNYKKLAVILMILISNKINEIGLKLGIRARNKGNGESVYDYFHFLNQQITNNFELKFVSNIILRQLKKIELIFIRKRGELSLNQVSELLSLYFDIKKLEVPNLYSKIDANYVRNNLNESYNFYFRKNNKSNSELTSQKSLLLMKLAENENHIKNKLSKRYNPLLFEKALNLKQIKEKLEKSNSQKIQISGRLKDNFSYQHSNTKNMLMFFIIGCIIIFFTLGVSFLFEMSINPFLINSLGFFGLMSFGAGGLFILIYWTNFHSGGA
ncbi:MAG: hypothetical protein GF317_13300 [Candidatus Lokiarchaeota archaeon]|nr:hypothetical protein [Candidatus Lokiarchaeota archaeon]MBD3200613.1 hypothetical protein [Candidatus Lokiarchaeota archaeon]